MVENFEGTYPHIDVKLETFANETYKSLLQIGLSSETPPDVFFNWPGEDTFRFARSGLVEELSPYMFQEGWWGNRIRASFLNEYKMDDGYWGAPYLVNAKGFFYNKKFFADHTLPIPETFDDLLNTCQAIKQADSYMTPILFGNNQRWPATHYMTDLNGKLVPESVRNGDYSLTASDGELFTHEGYVEAFAHLKKLQSSGCFRHAVNATSPMAAQAMFASEVGALVYCGNWCPVLFDQHGFRNQYGFFPMPKINGAKGNNDALLGGTEGPGISSKSRHKHEAALFINYLLSADAQKLMTTELARHPADITVAGSYDDGGTYREILSALEEAPVLSTWLDVALDNQVAEAYLNVTQLLLMDRKTPEEAAAEIRQAAIAAKQRRARNGSRAN